MGESSLNHKTVIFVGPPHERAQFYASEVVRPLAVQMMLAGRGAGPELTNQQKAAP